MEGFIILILLIILIVVITLRSKIASESDRLASRLDELTKKVDRLSQHEPDKATSRPVREETIDVAFPSVTRDRKSVV